MNMRFICVTVEIQLRKLGYSLAILQMILWQMRFLSTLTAILIINYLVKFL